MSEKLETEVIQDVTEDETCPSCRRRIYSLKTWIKLGSLFGDGDCPHCGAHLKLEFLLAPKRPRQKRYRLTYEYRRCP